MAKFLDINSEEYKLGQQIRKYRLLRGMTQNQLADLMDMERANISNYENGTKGEMGFRTLRRFGEALGVSVDILLGNKAAEDGLDEIITQLSHENRTVLKIVAEGLITKQRFTA